MDNMIIQLRGKLIKFNKSLERDKKDYKLKEY